MIMKYTEEFSKWNKENNNQYQMLSQFKKEMGVELKRTHPALQLFNILFLSWSFQGKKTEAKQLHSWTYFRQA